MPVVFMSPTVGLTQFLAGLSILILTTAFPLLSRLFSLFSLPPLCPIASPPSAAELQLCGLLSDAGVAGLFPVTPAALDSAIATVRQEEASCDSEWHANDATARADSGGLPLLWVDMPGSFSAMF